MSLASNRLSIRYLDDLAAGEKSPAKEAPTAAPESFQNEHKKPASSHQKTHQHSKEKVEQNELSNDASNETSDCENANPENPLTSTNLAAQNHVSRDLPDSSGRLRSSSATSPPTGEDSGLKSGVSTEATEAGSDPTSKTALPKKFFCKVCNQGFTRKHNMVSHEMIHTTIKLHRCVNCNLLFRRIHDLKRHEKLHTGEKPFHCESCDRSFARPDALTRHLNSPHACTGMKEPDEGPQRTQTSNTSSSSYQASKLEEARKIEEARQIEEDRACSLPGSKKAHINVPRMVKAFDEEQILALGPGSPGASLLATGKATAVSEPDSGATSSGADRPILSGPVSESTKGFHAPSSSVSGDSYDNVARSNYNINRWRAQQMNKGEKVSENIVRELMRKQTAGSKDKTALAPGPKAPQQLPNTAESQQPPDHRSLEYYQAYSPYHRLSASMAALNKTAFPGSGRGGGTSSESKLVLPDNSFNSSMPTSDAPRSDAGPPRVEEERSVSSPFPSSYYTAVDPYVAHQLLHSHPMQNNAIQGNAIQNNAMQNNAMQNNAMQNNSTQNNAMQNNLMLQQGLGPPHGPYTGATNLYGPVVPAQEGWQQNAPQFPPRSTTMRPSSSVHPSWSDVNSMRTDATEHGPYNFGPEFVRADTYYDLQNHANNLQTRIFSLEQRMEMLEERMKRDNKNNIKLQKRQEKKAKKKSKRASAK